MKKIVGLIEEVEIVGSKTIKCKAKFDTGAFDSSIDKKLAEKLSLKKTGKNKIITSSSIPKGVRRPVVEMILKMHGKEIKTDANIADRSHSKQKLLIGRNVIFNNFIVDVAKSNKSPKADDLK